MDQRKVANIIIQFEELKVKAKKMQQRTSPASQEGMYQAPNFLMLDPQVSEDYSWKRLIPAAFMVILV